MLAQSAPWGRAPDGTAVERVTLASPSGVTAVLLSWGATLARLLVPDRQGAPADVVLGFDELAGYIGAHPHLGGTIGRYANRIAGARFSLGGRVHRLSANEPPNHLHGGAIGFDRRPWRSETFQAPGEAGVVFRLESEDGDQGYPGTLQAEARYALSEAGELRVDLSARTDAPTVVSFTQHAYWNLGGDGSGDVLDHELETARSRHGFAIPEPDAFSSSRPPRRGCSSTREAGSTAPAAAEAASPTRVTPECVWSRSALPTRRTGQVLERSCWSREAATSSAPCSAASPIRGIQKIRAEGACPGPRAVALVAHRWVDRNPRLTRTRTDASALRRNRVGTLSPAARAKQSNAASSFAKTPSAGEGVRARFG